MSDYTLSSQDGGPSPVGSPATQSNELPGDLAETLAALATLDDDHLWQVAQQNVPQKEALRLEDLADKGQREGLSPAEVEEAEALADLHDRYMLVRGEAARLLKQRGRDVRALLPRG